MKNILVTGGTGFIGSNLCKMLIKEGYKVICVDNLSHSSEENIKEFFGNVNFWFYKLDIFDLNIKKVFEEHKIDVIIHLAAKVGVRDSMIDPVPYIKTNILGTQLLLDLAKQFNINKFIFASSSSIYGNQKVPFSEESVSYPISYYGITKDTGEKLCYMAHLDGLKVICLRFFTVYGPNGRKDMAPYIFTKNILDGTPIKIYGNGNSERDYTYIEDIIDAIIRAIETDLDFEIINLGNSKPIRLNRFIEIIEKVTKKKANIKKVSPQIGDVVKTFADISKAKRLLDWEPKINITEGMKRFIKWYKKNEYNRSKK